jgi:hypothetical protein
LRYEDNYGWHTQIQERSRFLVGLNFNTNNDLGKREYYLIFYFGRWNFVIGKFYKGQYVGTEN